jgi:hypothetical protein
MKRKVIKREDGKFLVEDEICGWVVCDQVQGYEEDEFDVIEYKGALVSGSEIVQSAFRRRGPGGF